ncbi:trehalose-phosphatase [Catellatospora sp. NPDC049609]|uniref:trehalose-phosphatase n=1 Tax=Catellatospora sp. NPDC049609 TaxID=3155505 RepID=UPI0034273791
MIESQSVTDALHIAAERRQTCGFFFDFDGTLSEIRDDPAGVVPVPGIVDAIAEIAGRVRTVAVVSGRPAEFLQRHFGALPVRLYGLYGMESVDEHGALWTDPEVLPWVSAVEEVVKRAVTELDPDVLVEDKRLSVALHYRTAPHLRGQVEDWGGHRAAEYGLAPLPGRMVLELKPPIRRDKGGVIRAATPDLDCVWYFGDDLGDLPALTALADRLAADPGFRVFRVGVSNPETGEQVAAMMDVVVNSPRDLVPLLRRAADACTPSHR